MKLASLVASAIAGLLFASPAAASVCKPSKVASAASSSSAAPSARPSACGVNEVSDSTFISFPDAWVTSGQQVVQWVNCLDSPLNCAMLQASGNSQSTISQTLTNLLVGQQYTFNYLYTVSNPSSDASFQCTITGADPFPLTMGTANGWLGYTNTFIATSATSEVSCTAKTLTGYMQLQLTSVTVSLDC